MGAGIGGDQACWDPSKALAAVRGGARAGKPRWVRILVITGDSMAAMIVKVPPRLHRLPAWLDDPWSQNRLRP